MPNPTNIEAELTAIHDRNRKVEADKAWETSWTRRLVIAGMTYVVALVWLSVIDNPSPWRSAFIPTVGYVLSTLSLPAVKAWWVRKR